MKLSIFSFVLLLLIFCSATQAQNVHTYVDSDSLRIGDILTYTIVFDGGYTSISYPDETVFEDDIEVISRQRYQLSARRDSIVYKLQYFSAEDLTIGRKAIRLQTAEGDTTVYTTPVPLFFKTTLAGENEEFRPLKPIFDFARAWWPIILLLLITAAAAYYLYRWYLARKRKPKEIPKPAEPPLPFKNPLDVLKNNLSALPNVHDLETREDFEQFYIGVGDAIRQYIKSIYTFPALEMTTREINLSLHKELAPNEIISITRSVLNEADIVKFANFRPSVEQSKSALHKAMEFVKTAEIVHREQIRYMKYKYEVDHGIIQETKISETAVKL